MEDNGQTESATTTAPSSGRLRTKVFIAAGALVAVAGSMVGVEVTTKGGLRDPQHSERVDGEELVLRSSCPMRLFTPTCSVGYVVYLPRGSNIVVHGNGSTITIESIVGDIDASTNGGAVDIRCDEAPNYVKGRSNGGRVMVEIPRGDELYRVDAGANGGTATVDVRTDPASDRQIDLHANGGKVEVRYAAQRV